jgi:hypothetical protein
LNVTSTSTGTATLLGSPIYVQGYTASVNLLNVTEDSMNASDAGLNGATSVVDGLTVNHQFGGATAKGSRSGIGVNLELTGSTGNASERPYNAYYNGIVSSVRGDANDGGTRARQIGSLYGVSVQATLAAGATYWGGIAGGEWDIEVRNGASVANKIGLQLQSTPNDAVQGSNIDTAILISSDNVGWKNGIMFGFPSGQGSHSPVSAGGTLIGSYPGGAVSVGNGIDLSSAKFSNCAFKSPGGFCVENNGTVQTPALTGRGAGDVLAINTGANGIGAVIAGSGGTNADYIQLTASLAGNPPIIAALGSDADAGLRLQSKGKGDLIFSVGGSMPALRIEGATAHEITAGPAPSINSCGPGGSITGNDNRGVVTIGASPCTINFAHAWSGAPNCVLSATASEGAYISSLSRDSLGIGSSAPRGTRVYYSCGQ